MSAEKTIYIVDDDDDDLLIMKEAMADLQFDIDVRYASNGQELLNILDKDVKNALILIDMNMPVMNGIEALRAVYTDPECSHLRSILMSTSNSDELIRLALNSGAMKVIHKPTVYAEYIALIREIVSKCF
jgi:CheY-like chemotaxis protein